MSVSTELPRIVFLLNISSKTCPEDDSVLLAVNRVIADIADGSYAGVVAIDSRTGIRNKMIPIINNKVRDVFMENIGKVAKNGIDIEFGLRFALKSLSDADCSSNGAVIAMVIKKQDKNSSDFESIIKTLRDEQVKIICIAIGENADQNVELLTEKTDGNLYYISSPLPEYIWRTIEEAVHNEYSTKSNTITVCDVILVIETEIVTHFAVDSDIGRNTAITIGSKNDFRFAINSPKGKLTNDDYMVNDKLKRLECSIKNTLTGVWSVTIANKGRKEILVHLNVKTQPLYANPIRMNAFIINADVYAPKPPIIVVELCKGDSVVFGAKVEATIDRPDNTQRQIELYFHHDVYCNYFIDFTKSGRYNVSVLATNDGHNCYLQNRLTKIKETTAVQDFRRQQMVGCFKVTDCMLQLGQLKSKTELEQYLTDLSSKWKFNQQISTNNRSKQTDSNKNAPRARPRSTQSNAGLDTPILNHEASTSKSSPVPPRLTSSSSILYRENTDNSFTETSSQSLKKASNTTCAPTLVPTKKILNKVSAPNSSSRMQMELEDEMKDELFIIPKIISAAKISSAEKGMRTEKFEEIKDYLLNHKNKTLEQLTEYSEYIKALKSELM